MANGEQSHIRLNGVGLMKSANLLVRNTVMGRNGQKIKVQVSVGQLFGSAEVIGEPFWSYFPGSKWRSQSVVCVCRKCGTVFVVRAVNLTGGYMKSCGCMSRHTHGGACNESRENLYSIYSGMIQRCHNPKSQNYKRYGEKGIEICEEWRESYSAFRSWAMKNGYEKGLSIDRKKSDQGYNPDNCQWISRGANSKKMWSDMKKRSDEKDAEIAKLRIENARLIIAFVDTYQILISALSGLV